MILWLKCGGYIFLSFIAGVTVGVLLGYSGLKKDAMDDVCNEVKGKYDFCKKVIYYKFEEVK